jgi:hypothetical protein
MSNCDCIPGLRVHGVADEQPLPKREENDPEAAAGAVVNHICTSSNNFAAEMIFNPRFSP